MEKAVNYAVTTQVKTRICGQDQEGGEPVRSAPVTGELEDGTREEMHLHRTCRGSRHDYEQRTMAHGHWRCGSSRLGAKEAE